MIDQVEMMRVIEKLRGDAVVVPAMRANVGWAEVSTNVRRDVPASGAMGKTNSFALGVALARPENQGHSFRRGWQSADEPGLPGYRGQ